MDHRLNAEELFDRMCEWDDHNFLMAAGSKGNDDASDTDGIVDGHAYTILDCVGSVAGTEFDLIKVRNPWGKGEFKSGNWNDDGPGWHHYPAVKEALKPVSLDDGIFWLQKEEFFQYFHTVYLCACDVEQWMGGHSAPQKKAPQAGQRVRPRSDSPQPAGPSAEELQQQQQQLQMQQDERRRQDEIEYHRQQQEWEQRQQQQQQEWAQQQRLQQEQQMRQQLEMEEQHRRQQEQDRRPIGGPARSPNRAAMPSSGGQCTASMGCTCDLCAQSMGTMGSSDRGQPPDRGQDRPVQPTQQKCLGNMSCTCDLCAASMW